MCHTTHLMPTHCLDPFENDVKYLSKRPDGFAFVGCGLIQRDGSNFSGSGKMSGFILMKYVVSLTGV
jgi:hypothetical protein